MVTLSLYCDSMDCLQLETVTDQDLRWKKTYKTR